MWRAVESACEGNAPGAPVLQPHRQTTQACIPTRRSRRAALKCYYMKIVSQETSAFSESQRKSPWNSELQPQWGHGEGGGIQRIRGSPTSAGAKETRTHLHTQPCPAPSTTHTPGLGLGRVWRDLGPF